jgi:hypothetical protein
MPYKFTEGRRHKFSKARYRMTTLGMPATVRIR